MRQAYREKARLQTNNHNLNVKVALKPSSRQKEDSDTGGH